MKLAANLSMLYTELPFIERFAAAAADGFTAIEIQFPYDTPAEDIRQQLDEYGLRCVLINVPAGDLMQGGLGLAGVPGREEQFAEALALCCEYVRILCPSRVNVLAGRQSAEHSRAECLAVLVANLERALAALVPLQVLVTFEAINTTDMPGFLVSSFADMSEVMVRVGNPDLRMQFDIYHMAMMNEPVAELLSAQMEQIGHIQFADMPGRHEPGTGTIDFAGVFEVIRASAYDGWVAAEYRPGQALTSDGLGWFRQPL